MPKGMKPSSVAAGLKTSTRKFQFCNTMKLFVAYCQMQLPVISP